MIGPCMCGDSMCPSCGPAQGYNPEEETVREYLAEHVLTDIPEGIDAEWLVDFVLDRLGKDQGIAGAMFVAGQEWHRQAMVGCPVCGAPHYRCRCGGAAAQERCEPD